MSRHRDQVVTHTGTQGTVALCEEHEEYWKAYVGPDYLGVHEGLHAGVCEVCEYGAPEREDEAEQ